MLRIWPPLRGAGIRVLDIAKDFSSADVELRRRWYNRNYMGTHFGGSLFAMTDPFWMIMVAENLGRDFVVWDKAAEIEFVSPGRGTVHASFRIDPERIEVIRTAAQDGAKHLEWFETDVISTDGTLVARVRKQLHIRRKRISSDPEAPRSPFSA